MGIEKLFLSHCLKVINGQFAQQQKNIYLDALSTDLGIFLWGPYYNPILACLEGRVSRVESSIFGSLDYTPAQFMYVGIPVQAYIDISICKYSY